MGLRRILLGVLIGAAAASCRARPTEAPAPASPGPSIKNVSEVCGGPAYGRVVLAAAAPEGVRISTVQFLLDGALLGAVHAPPFTLAWDSRAATNFDHVLTVKAYDAGGNASTSSCPIAVRNVKRVFVTSAEYTAAMDGLPGADMRCMSAAR